MANSVTSSTRYLSRTTGSICSGSYTLLLAIKFPDAPANGVYRGVAGLLGRLLNAGGSMCAVGQDPPDDGDDTYVFLKGSDGTTNKGGGVANSTTDGHWVHIAIVFTGNTTAGSVNLYAALEGFNPASPSYLYTVNQGGVDPARTTGTTYIFTDGDIDLPGGARIGHVILTPQALTEAQLLAQFAQRAPTAVVTGGGSYTYLSCTDAANVHVDSGTFATNFTAAGAGVFSDSQDQPSEWANSGLIMGSPTLLF